jgi:hypothetical protein
VYSSRLVGRDRPDAASGVILSSVRRAVSRDSFGDDGIAD